MVVHFADGHAYMLGNLLGGLSITYDKTGNVTKYENADRVEQKVALSSLSEAFGSARELCGFCCLSIVYNPTNQQTLPYTLSSHIVAMA